MNGLMIADVARAIVAERLRRARPPYAGLEAGVSHAASDESLSGGGCPSVALVPLCG